MLILSPARKVGKKPALNKDDEYKLEVSYGFVSVTLLVTAFASFVVGIFVRSYLVNKHFSTNGSSSYLHDPQMSIAAVTVPALVIDPPSQIIQQQLSSLPQPTLADGKENPNTFYTGRHFTSERSLSHHSMYLQRSVKEDSFKNADIVSNDSVYADDEELHLPAGQHLLVDIKHVDESFLNSESRLAQAMIEIINLSKLTLLSYHCHRIVPEGISCVGVLLESHVSFHTKPSHGVIFIDLFTCGSGELLPILPIIQRLFGVPAQQQGNQDDLLSTTNDDEGPTMVWSHKLRGFRDEEEEEHLLSQANELGQKLSSMSVGHKTVIASVETPYQHVGIVDVIEHHYQSYAGYLASIDESNKDSYEYRNRHLFKPDRQVLLSGVTQSTRLGNEAYHESLVQPAMFLHPNPKRVAIIGGGEGATLKEVLKHKSVEKVKMIDIDKDMVYASKNNLFDWCSCKDFVDRDSEWCGDDVRAEVYCEDAISWFNYRFSDELKIDSDEYKEERFDLLIMDALDPQDDIPFAEVLYRQESFLKSLYNALNDDGMIVLQLGQAPDIRDPPEEHSRNSRRASLNQFLERVGFEAIVVYEEGHSFFTAPWSYTVAMKRKSHRSRWFRTSSEIDLDIKKRIVSTHSGQPALKYFDGATMQQYRIPHKGFELIFCKSNPTPLSCLSGSQSRHDVDVKVSIKDVVTTNNSTLKLGRHSKSDPIGDTVRHIYDPYLDRREQY